MPKITVQDWGFIVDRYFLDRKKEFPNIVKTHIKFNAVKVWVIRQIGSNEYEVKLPTDGIIVVTNRFLKPVLPEPEEPQEKRA